MNTGKQVREPLLGHNDEIRTIITASPDGHWIVSGGAKGSISVWEVGTNKRAPISFKSHEDVVRSVEFAPDSETFASAAWDKTVCVWKKKTGKIALGPPRVRSWANSVSYSPDGSKLAAGTKEHIIDIIVCNSSSGEELLKVEQRAWRVAFTPDGLRLVSGDLTDIRVSDAATGNVVKRFDAHTSNFLSLAITPDDTKLATT
jgi:WD40 repeat protein